MRNCGFVGRKSKIYQKIVKTSIKQFSFQFNIYFLKAKKIKFFPFKLFTGKVRKVLSLSKIRIRIRVHKIFLTGSEDLAHGGAA